MYKLYGKRLFDTPAALCILILLFPLLILIVIFINIFDPGPIIFCQNRIGKNGVKFILFKFRSMPITTKNLPSDKLDKLQLSWIGKLIRRTNIDELPQLLNIFLLAQRLYRFIVLYQTLIFAVYLIALNFLGDIKIEYFFLIWNLRYLFDFLFIFSRFTKKT